MINEIYPLHIVFNEDYEDLLVKDWMEKVKINQACEIVFLSDVAAMCKYPVIKNVDYWSKDYEIQTLADDILNGELARYVWCLEGFDSIEDDPRLFMSIKLCLKGDLSPDV